MLGAGLAIAQPAPAAKKTSKKSSTAPTFQPGCPIPFANPSSGLAIDGSCPINGLADPKSAEGLQNMAKNNFCATGPAITVTPAILGKLQAATKGVTFGGEAEVPTDRTLLHKGFAVDGVTYHEGQLVRMAAFIIETHPADLSSGENVNCKKTDALENDVHMALGTAHGANECTSVTAELSPHSRPTQWKPLFDVAKAKAGTAGPAITKTPIRVQGQLFFDASHKICNGSTAVSGNPARQSLWEIHPVYQVDVCKNSTLAACKVDDDTVWTPLDPPAPAH
jgi:hypothetical protein